MQSVLFECIISEMADTAVDAVLALGTTATAAWGTETCAGD